MHTAIFSIRDEQKMNCDSLCFLVFVSENKSNISGIDYNYFRNKYFLFGTLFFV